jgi:hypothetical protein
MSKALAGAALLGGAVLAGIGAAVLASTGVGFVAIPLLLHASEALALAGISMEAGAVASALSTNRGANITVRTAAGYRQVIYGTQRVGGNIVYVNTTGSKHDQVNYVIAIAGHQLDSIVNVYLDGRQVFFNAGSVGNGTRNGVNFGGSADGNDHPGPNGEQYNFGGLVYFEACYGDQTNQPNTVPGGGFNTGLQANDPTWAPNENGIPYLGGCTYVYFKYVYDAVQFPQPPEVRFTVRGKCDIYDPRTGTTGYSHNWALVNGDIFANSNFGFGDSSKTPEENRAVLNLAQWIAAANVCDEQVNTLGGMEARFCCHKTFDTSVSPGSMLTALMPAAAGRYSVSGGEVYLWPAYWRGPEFAFDADALAAPFDGSAYVPRRSLINRVTGKYTAANYPYNATTQNGSNLYDANGFYDGTIQNNFGLAFQPSSFPYYAEDVLHGFPADANLAADGGRLLPRDLDLTSVLSVAQAQRVARIVYRRNRMRGKWMLSMFPVAFRMQQIDVMQFSMPQLGWTNKLFEVDSVSLGVAPGHGGVPVPQVQVIVGDTDPSVYEDPEVELSVYAVPTPLVVSVNPNPPTLMTVNSVPLEGADGVVTPRVLLAWDEPEDARAVSIEAQYQTQPAGGVAGAWMPAGTIGIASTSLLVTGVVSGQVYGFRIRSVRANGAVSIWVEVDGYTVVPVVSTISSAGLNPNSPYNVSNNATVDSIAENGAATIRVYGPGGDGSSFVRYQGAAVSSMAAAHITGEAFDTTYYVVFDTVALVYSATTNYNSTLADQYIYIGQVVTCDSTYTGGSGGTGGTGGTGSGGSAGGGGSAPGGGRSPVAQPVQKGT